MVRCSLALQDFSRSNLHTTIRLKYMVLFNLIFLGSHWFISVMCTRPFDKNVSSSFIYSFFCLRPFDQNEGPHWFIYFICTRPFDQKLGSSLINLFHLYTTIRPKIRVPINLIFFVSTRLFDQKLGSSLIYFFCTRHHSTKN